MGTIARTVFFVCLIALVAVSILRWALRFVPKEEITTAVEDLPEKSSKESKYFASSEEPPSHSSHRRPIPWTGLWGRRIYRLLPTCPPTSFIVLPPNISVNHRFCRWCGWAAGAGPIHRKGDVVPLVRLDVRDQPKIWFHRPKIKIPGICSIIDRRGPPDSGDIFKACNPPCFDARVCTKAFKISIKELKLLVINNWGCCLVISELNLIISRSIAIFLTFLFKALYPSATDDNNPAP